MAAKNHVRALVHSTGATMTWALGYYGAFRFEISKNPTDDMTLDEVVDLAAGGRSVTFTDVLEEILSPASSTYSEFMIVAHGSPKGLIMPLGPGLPSADKDNLPAMTEMAGIIAERDRLNALSDSKQQLDGWKKLLSRVSGTRIANGGTFGHIFSDQLDAITSAADAQKWLETMSPTVNKISILADPVSLKLLNLRNKVVARKLARVEVRACNLGGDSDGMSALREFLGATRVLAPMVKTFYAHVSPKLFTSEAEYNVWLKRNAGWLLGVGSEPPGTRTYLGSDLFLKMDAKRTTPMAVLKLVQPSSQTCAGLAGDARNYAMIKLLVDNNIDVKQSANYHGGAFFVGGLDPVAGRTASNPPPVAANGKPFLLASEPEYRAMIVSSP